jgi:hypothetical protein
MVYSVKFKVRRSSLALTERESVVTVSAHPIERAIAHRCSYKHHSSILPHRKLRGDGNYNATLLRGAACAGLLSTSPLSGLGVSSTLAGIGGLGSLIGPPPGS